MRGLGGGGGGGRGGGETKLGTTGLNLLGKKKRFGTASLHLSGVITPSA